MACHAHPAATPVRSPRRSARLLAGITLGLTAIAGPADTVQVKNGPAITPLPLSDGRNSYDGLQPGSGPETAPSVHTFVPLNPADRIEKVLVDRVDCSSTGHGFQSDGRTTLEKLATGRRFRVTQAPKKKIYEFGKRKLYAI